MPRKAISMRFSRYTYKAGFHQDEAFRLRRIADQGDFRRFPSIGNRPLSLTAQPIEIPLPRLICSISIGMAARGKETILNFLIGFVNRACYLSK